MDTNEHEWFESGSASEPLPIIRVHLCPILLCFLLCDLCDLCGDVIVACAKVRPTGIADLEPSSVKKKLKDKSSQRQ